MAMRVGWRLKSKGWICPVHSGGDNSPSVKRKPPEVKRKIVIRRKETVVRRKSE
jgi:hypothetical protein